MDQLSTIIHCIADNKWQKQFVHRYRIETDKLIPLIHIFLYSNHKQAKIDVELAYPRCTSMCNTQGVQVHIHYMPLPAMLRRCDMTGILLCTCLKTAPPIVITQ